MNIAKVNEILKDEWHCPPSVSRGRIIDTTVIPGFLVTCDEVIKGVITYLIENEECEIVTLNSFEENRGIGTALINAVIDVARNIIAVEYG